MGAWQHIAEQWVNEKMTSDHEFYKIVADVHRRLRRGDYPQNYVDVVFQSHYRSIMLVDAYIFGILHADLVQGKIGVARVGLHTCPFADKAVEENNEVLRQLPLPFIGRFRGGSGSCDGTISWRAVNKWKWSCRECGTVFITTTENVKES
jgi:hypothetical protein